MTRKPSAAAIDRAIADDLAGVPSRYPDRVAFVDADEPHAGREIIDALKGGYAVVLVAPDGREYIISEGVPAS